MGWSYPQTKRDQRSWITHQHGFCTVTLPQYWPWLLPQHVQRACSPSALPKTVPQVRPSPLLRCLSCTSHSRSAARKSLRCSGAGGGRSHAIVAVYVLDVSDGNAAPAAGSTVSICWGVSLGIGVFLAAGRRVSVADGYRPPERRYPARRCDTRPSHLSSMCAHDEHRAHAEAYLPPVHHAMVAVIMP